MSDLTAGTVITGTDVTPAVLDGASSAQTGFTTTTYAYDGMGVAFVAPITGRVLVQWGGWLDTNGANTVYLSFEVRTGSTLGAGSVVFAASDENAAYHFNTNQCAIGMFCPVSGLTAGSSYHVRLMHRVTGGTGSIDNQEVNVIPLT